MYLDFHFIFGNTGLSRKYKGLTVSEKCPRSLYIATKRAKNSYTIKSIAYREFMGVRIATTFHNSQYLFGVSSYVLLPHNRFRGETYFNNIYSSVEDSLTVFNRDTVGNGC